MNQQLIFQGVRYTAEMMTNILHQWFFRATDLINNSGMNFITSRKDVFFFFLSRPKSELNNEERPKCGVVACISQLTHNVFATTPMVFFCPAACCSRQEKMPPKETGPSRSQGVNLYIKNLVTWMGKKPMELERSEVKRPFFWEVKMPTKYSKSLDEFRDFLFLQSLCLQWLVVDLSYVSK